MVLIYLREFLKWKKTSVKMIFCLTDKCFACLSRSSPGAFGVEMGIDPVNWLSARSSQNSFVRFPKEQGISPLKLFELSALQCTWKHKNILQVLQFSMTATTQDDALLILTEMIAVWDSQVHLVYCLWNYIQLGPWETPRDQCISWAKFSWDYCSR